MQMVCCAFEEKAKRRIMNMKPNFFNVYCTLLKVKSKWEYFLNDRMKGMFLQIQRLLFTNFQIGKIALRSIINPQADGARKIIAKFQVVYN